MEDLCLNCPLPVCDEKHRRCKFRQAKRLKRYQPRKRLLQNARNRRQREQLSAAERAEIKRAILACLGSLKNQA